MAGVAVAPHGRVDGINGAAHSGRAPAAHGAKVDSRISGSSGTASDRGRPFCTPINRGRKRHTGDGDDDNEGSLSGSNTMGMMMMMQPSEQSTRDTNCTARKTENALWREEIIMRRKEMTSQLQIQRKESHAHQQMMNVMLMAMIQNIGQTNRQQRTDIGGANQHQRTEIGGNNQQQMFDIIGGTNQQQGTDSANDNK